MNSLGILVSDLYDPYQATLLKGVQHICNKYGVKIYTFVGGAVGSDFTNSIYSLINTKNVDALLIFSGSLVEANGLQGLELLIWKLPNIPILSIGIEVPGVHSIIIDNKKGTFETVDHLIKVHSAKKIAFIKGPEENQEAVDRFLGYQECLKAHGISYNNKLVAPGSFSPGDGSKGLNLILETRKETVDAVVCTTDDAAIEVITSLVNKGFNVPKDILVVGFDNLDSSSSFSPSLTTVGQPIFHIGSLAAEYIIDIYNGKSVKALTVINTKFVIRESCGCRRDNVFEQRIEEVDIVFSDFPRLIHSISGMVIEKNTLETSSSEYMTLLKRSILIIADSIIKSYHTMTIAPLGKAIDSILTNSFSLNLTASFWRNIIEDFFLALAVGKYSIESHFFLSSLLSSTILRLYESEKRVVEQKNVTNRELIKYISEIGDRLLLCRNQSDLKEILRLNLSMLKITHCYIVLLGSNGYGELFFSKQNDDIDRSKFPTYLLLPKIVGDSANLSYVITPLRIDNKIIGYMMIKNIESSSIIYEFLAEKLSYGFKNIKITEEMESYTIKLEKAVLERTKELKLANNQLQTRSMRDQLTGLKNRRFLDEVVIPNSEKLVKKIKNQVKFGNRSLELKGNISYGVIFVDLDHFKYVNDVYGHDSGDLVIKELGKLFTYAVREEDYVIRLGGEEFLLILTNFNSKYIKNVVEKVRKTVEDTPFTMFNGEVIHKTCSLGAISFPLTVPDLINFKEAVAIIDKCLYLAKDKGRNRGVIINIDSEQFIGSENAGEYIIDNFNRCIDSGKIIISESFLK